MTCKNCGTENQSGEFCQKCGLYLDPKANLTEEEKAKAKLSMFKNCGQTIKNFASTIYALLFVLNIIVGLGGLIGGSLLMEDFGGISGLVIIASLILSGIGILLAKVISAMVFGYGIIVSNAEKQQTRTD